MAGKDATRRWRDWLMLVLAVWLFISPWVLRFSTAPMLPAPAGAAPAPAGGAMASTAGLTTAAWNAWVLGIVIALLAIWAIAMFAQWQDWLTGICGVWLVIAPWVLRFSAMVLARWDHVIVGVLVIVLAAWELWAVRQEGARAPA
jgi:hypothetical protein